MNGFSPGMQPDHWVAPTFRACLSEEMGLFSFKIIGERLRGN